MSDSEEEVFLNAKAEQFWKLFSTSTATDFCVSRPASHIANPEVGDVKSHHRQHNIGA